MFKLFKRRKGQITVAHRGWNKAAEWMDKQQRKAAGWLQVKASTLSARTQTILLLLFCLVVAGCSSYILYKALY